MICNMGGGDLRNGALLTNVYQTNWTMSTLFLCPLVRSEAPVGGADFQA
jgi:hypothetical protein